MATTEAPPTAEWMPIAEAAVRLGVSQDAIRRRLKGGQLEGKRELMPQGFRWLVLLKNEAGDTSSAEVAQGSATRQVGAESQNGHAQGGAQVADLAIARAQEMAAYSEQLVAPYVRRIEELSREIGELRARLEAQPQTAAYEDAPQRGWPEARRWWQRLLWG
jgi:phenylpropionate dioxygenase-like ring-hydroxylating dioxygenase large terminal subunit